ncbi:aromatic ring-hydroxylating oxygenase subunit alpha [Vibrio fluvialis]|uniref:aromatic ring-hydroxylating oxygenase subunit alpha n=1 Tax=Vibrio fluvialis TaxID=676 RepID=UPI002E111ABC
MTQNDLLNISYANLDMARTEMTKLLSDRKPDYSLPRPLYNDPYLFRIDVEEIFQKEWLFVGMTSEIPSKGDYFTVEIAQNPVLIVRDVDGSVNAFHNTCRHRGSRICLEHRAKSPIWCALTINGRTTPKATCSTPGQKWAKSSICLSTNFAACIAKRQADLSLSA